MDCAETSLDYGYDVMTRTDFWFTDRIPVLTMNMSECKKLCKSTNCSMFVLSESLSTCRVYATSRYNPHSAVSFVNFMSTKSEVFTPLCIKGK